MNRFARWLTQSDWGITLLTMVTFAAMILGNCIYNG